MKKNKKDILDRIKKQESSNIDVSHWEAFDFDAHVAVYFGKHNCSWREAVKAVSKSYEFNPYEYQGINDLSDLIDDELLAEIIKE